MVAPPLVGVLPLQLLVEAGIEKMAADYSDTLIGVWKCAVSDCRFIRSSFFQRQMGGVKWINVGINIHLLLISYTSNPLNWEFSTQLIFQSAPPLHPSTRPCTHLLQEDSPHFNNNILLWGFNTHRLIKLQKRAIRIITDSKYNSHTEPLLKSLNILKINDIFTIQCLKFFHNYINDRVPVFFRSFFVEHALYHDYETRHCHNIGIPHSHTTKARKCIRYHIPMLLNYVTSANRICKLYKTAAS